MSEITLSTPAEAQAFDRFRALELQSCAAKPVDGDEMIDACLAESYDLCTSARAAETAYGSPYHSSVVRRAAVLKKTAEFLGMIQQHRDEVLPILQGGSTKRARRV